MTRKNTSAIALAGFLSISAPALANGAAPEGYPVIDQESISLLQLDYGQDNAVGEDSVHHSIRSSVAYSGPDNTILHAWLAEYNKTTDEDNEDDQAIFVQMFDGSNGEPVSGPIKIHETALKGFAGDDDQLTPLPGDSSKFLHKVDVNSLNAVYEPESGDFLVVWNNILVDSATPTYPLAHAEREGMALLGVAIRKSETGEWSSRDIQTIRVAEVLAHSNKSYSRPGLGGLHRFGIRVTDDITVSHIAYSNESGFSYESDFQVAINDEIAAMDEGGIDPKPFMTRSYDVAYDDVHDRYTVIASLVERYVSAPFGDGGDLTTTEYRFFSGIVFKTFDESLIHGDIGNESLRSILAYTDSSEFIRILHAEGDPIPYPVRTQFEQTGVLWQPATDTTNAKIDFFWSGRQMTPTDGATGVGITDEQHVSVRRYKVRPGGTLALIDGVPHILPNTTNESRLMYTPLGYWDENSGINSLVWGDTQQVFAQAISGTDAALPMPATFEVNVGITPRSHGSFTNIAPQVLEIGSDHYIYFSSVNGAALRKLDWQWVDLSGTARLVGADETDPIALESEFPVEVVVSNLDIGELPVDHDSGAFRISIQNHENLELVSHDERLEGTLADGFTFDAASGGIAAGDSSAFEFVFRNVNSSDENQSTELLVSVDATDHFDNDIANDSSAAALILAGPGDDSGSGDDTGDDSDDGSGDDSGNDSGDSPDDDADDDSDDGPDDSSDNDPDTGTGSGGGGAIFWLLGIMGLSRLRR